MSQWTLGTCSRTTSLLFESMGSSVSARAGITSPFLVNEALVFRLPWHLVERAHGGVDAPTALAEVGLLQAVAGRLPVVVPEPVYVADHGQYFGYRYLPGEDLAQLLRTTPTKRTSSGVSSSSAAGAKPTSPSLSEACRADP